MVCSQSTARVASTLRVLFFFLHHQTFYNNLSVKDLFPPYAFVLPFSLSCFSFVTWPASSLTYGNCSRLVRPNSCRKSLVVLKSVGRPTVCARPTSVTRPC